MPYVPRAKLILVDEPLVRETTAGSAFAAPSGETAAAVRAFFDNGGRAAVVSRATTDGEDPGPWTPLLAVDAVEPFA